MHQKQDQQKPPSREIPFSLFRYRRLKSSRSRRFRRRTTRKILRIKEAPNNPEETEGTPIKNSSCNSNKNHSSRKKSSKGNTAGNLSPQIRKSIDIFLCLFFTYKKTTIKCYPTCSGIFHFLYYFGAIFKENLNFDDFENA